MRRALAAAFAVTLPVLAQSPSPDDPDRWFASGRAAPAARRAVDPIAGPAKNVILVVGDGMGVSTVTAGRIFDGQSRGEPGEDNVLSFDAFPHTALIKTYNTNAQVADSAGTATAMLSGVKTKIGVVGLNDAVVPERCTAMDAAYVPTLLELAEAAGLATGIVTTTRLTHATPAAAYAHSPSRNWEDAVPEGAAGCRDIAAQFAEFDTGNGIEVALAGGRANFLPEDMTDGEGAPGRRKDGRNLVDLWQQRYPSGRYVWNQDGFDQLDPAMDGPVLGLFEPSHMDYEADRAQDVGGEPSLSEMVAFAIDKLSRASYGYFLLVEGGRIDHAHHAGNAHRALVETQMLAQAVATARTLTDPADTLILVTADHSHVFTMAGYPPRGNPILGLVRRIDSETGEPQLARDGKPYTTLGYWNGPGAIAGERAAVDAETAQSLDYKQQAAVPTYGETHGGEDVALYASGPEAHLVGGTWEQHVIFHLMDHALGGLSGQVCASGEAAVCGRGGQYGQ